jgi:hypothetical protein
MFLLDYDEFNAYTTESDVVEYVESLISEGIEDGLYEKCIDYFGHGLKTIIDSLFCIEEDVEFEM